MSFVSISTLNVRSKPGVTHPVVCQLHDHDEVSVESDVTKQDGYDWVLVNRYGWDIGYVAANYLTDISFRPQPIDPVQTTVHHEQVRSHIKDERKLMGQHVVNIHDEPWHKEIAEKVKPSVIKIMDGDVQTWHDYYSRSPDSLFVYRSYATTDGGGERKTYMITGGDPHAVATQDARDTNAQWAHIEQQARDRGLTVPDREQVIFESCNEIHVWDNLGKAIEYEVQCCDDFAHYGMRHGALCQAVGHPGAVKEGAWQGSDHMPDWSGYEPLWDALEKHPHHVLCLHEYSPKEGFAASWPWYMGRYTSCPWNGAIVFTEVGVERYTTEPNVDGNERGWQSVMSAEEYLGNWKWLVAKWAEDPRILGGTHYVNDSGRPWYVSFNCTEELSKLWIDWAS